MVKRIYTTAEEPESKHQMYEKMIYCYVDSNRSTFVIPHEITSCELLLLYVSKFKQLNQSVQSYLRCTREEEKTSVKEAFCSRIQTIQSLET